MSKFTKDQRDWIVDSYLECKNITQTAKLFLEENNLPTDHKYVDKTRKSVSVVLRRRNINSLGESLEDTDEFIDSVKREFKESKVYIITTEQNDTPVHERFFKNILAYKDFHSAELFVILGRYNNRSSSLESNGRYRWNESTKPYWVSGKVNLHKYITLDASVKLSFTRKNPLRGLEDLVSTGSLIVGHPKMHLKVEPTLNGYPHKVLVTSGAVTIPNYTKTLNGEVSAINHKLGFTIVEVKDNETYSFRQVEAIDNGDFIDLCFEVVDGNVNRISKADGIVLGDSHHYNIDGDIDELNDEICKAFNPNWVVMHDVVDGESANNHIVNSPIQRFHRYSKGQHLMMKELEDLGDWLEKKIDYNIVVPRANHNDRFDRILEQDWRKDIENALFYMDYTKRKLLGEASKGVVAHYLEGRFGGTIKCLDYTDSFKIGNYECAHHGDHGPNGARNSFTSSRKLNIPSIYGHTHTPYRADDVFFVGTNTKLLLGYNERGPSSWMHANVLVAKNGIAQHILFFNKFFTNFKLMQQI